MNIGTVFLIGAILFFVGTGVLVFAYVYYVWRGYALIAKYSCDCTRWTQTRWLYPTFIVSLFLMGVLYISMYLGQGFSSKPNNLLVMWERWLILAIVAFLFSRALTYIMTINSKDEQSFALVLAYTLAYATLLPAVLSQAFQTRLLWTIVSIIFFLAAILFYIFPDNKFNAAYHIPARFHYYKLFFAFLILYFLYNIVVYLLSASNEYTTVLNFYAEVVAYLVGDAIFLLGFALIVTIATFVNLKDTIRVVNKHTGTVLYAATLTTNKKAGLGAL